MARQCGLLLAVALTIANAGCVGSDRPEHTAPVSVPDSPEETYRQLMLALLSGDQSTISNLIVSVDGAEILWQEGAYPKEVAALLAEQYRTMEISRIKQGADEKANVFQFSSSAFPLPLGVQKVAGSWKVDARPIIEMRKSAQKVRSENR